MSEYLNEIVYVTKEQYETLRNNTAVNGHTYASNNMYITSNERIEQSELATDLSNKINNAYAHAVTNKGIAKTSGLYKITTNDEGHITAATAVVKADLTGLGIPGSDTTYTFDGTYNPNTNKAATMSSITNAINALDVSNITANLGAGKTITALSETDGKIAATASNISITVSQISNFTLATGDSNGQVKIAGTNVSVKGLGSAAYTNTSAYVAYKGNLNTLGGGTPAAATKTYWEDNDNIPTLTVNAAYNNAGTEFSLLFSKGASTGYGSVIKWGYNDKYIYILRRQGSTWKSDDWEKISAGYADTAPWSGISDKPTTISGYGITDAKITSGVITLGSNTITPVTSVNGHTGSSITVTAGDLGLASALRYVGKTTSTMSESFTGVPAGITDYTTPIVGDVVLDSSQNAEYVCRAKSGSTYTWELLGAENSYKIVQTAVNNSTGTADGTNTATSFLYSYSQDTNGNMTIKSRALPIASTSIAGIIQIGTGATNAPAGNCAPSTPGTANHILISSGGTTAPVWTASAILTSAMSTTANTAAYDILTLGNAVNVSSTTAHSEGKLTLYSAATAAHTLVGQSTTAAHTHTLPNTDGTLLDTENAYSYVGIEILRL